MLKKISFHWKLYITYSIIISFILAVALAAFYQYNAGLLDTNMEEASLNTLKVSEERLDDLLEDMDKQLSFLHTLPEFMEYTEEISENDAAPNYFAYHPTDALQIQRIFLSLLVNDKSSSSITYISSGYNNIHAAVSGKYQESLDNENMKKYINVKEIFESGESSLCIFPHRDFWSLEEENVISVYRPVRDMFHTYGLLVLDKNVEELNAVLTSNEDEVFLIDRNTDFWYSTNTGTVDEEEKKILQSIPEDTDTGFLTTKKNFSYYYCDSEMTGWTMVLKKDISFYADEKMKLEGTIIWIFIAGVILILCLVYFVSQNLSAPLRKLKESLEEQGTSSAVHLEVATDNNEITMLSTTIEQIMNQIHVQNQKLIAAKELALKAHINALEAQMNPHFLYNTLSVIGTYGMENGDSAVPRMCRELSSLLRYSMTYNNQSVKLSDEAENVKSYLYIMQMRYEHMLECDMELDKDIENVPVPKLILQPIVENCFKHGFKDVPPIWKIKIRFWHTQDRWFVSVANNGAPPKERAAEVMSKLMDSIQASFDNDMVLKELGDESGLGLKNTVIRLHMFYQGKECFRFFEEDGLTIIELGGTIHEGEY